MKSTGFLLRLFPFIIQYEIWKFAFGDFQHLLNNRFGALVFGDIDDGFKGIYCILYKVEEVMPKSRKSAKRKAADQRKAAKKKQSLSS